MERTITPFFTNLPKSLPGPPTPRKYREPHVELLFKAFRQLILTPREQRVLRPPPERDTPVSRMEETDVAGKDERESTHDLIRSFSATAGQPARCVRPACRRNNRCCGDPPDCWPDLPLVESEQQFSLLQYALYAMLGERMRIDAGESDEFSASTR